MKLNQQLLKKSTFSLFFLADRKRSWTLASMKTLIVHPEDNPSTTFLTGIYKNLDNKTVINGGITKDELRKYIQDHDRVICCGPWSCLVCLELASSHRRHHILLTTQWLRYCGIKSSSLYGAMPINSFIGIVFTDFIAGCFYHRRTRPSILTFGILMI